MARLVEAAVYLTGAEEASLLLVDSRTELPPGSPVEVEIRAATIWGVELLRRALAEVGALNAFGLTRRSADSNTPASLPTKRVGAPKQPNATRSCASRPVQVACDR